MSYKRLWEVFANLYSLLFIVTRFFMELQNLRPEIPRCCPSALANVMKRCWDANPDKRPEMDEVVTMLWFDVDNLLFPTLLAYCFCNCQ